MSDLDVTADRHDDPHLTIVSDVLEVVEAPAVAVVTAGMLERAGEPTAALPEGWGPPAETASPAGPAALGRDDPTEVIVPRELLPLSEDDPAALGRYTLLQRIPGGQDTSRKYLAQRISPDDPGAPAVLLFIKWVPMNLLRGERWRTQAYREKLVADREYLATLLYSASEKLALIGSPHLPRLVEFVGSDPAGVFMVEEFIVGTPLRDYLAQFPGGIVPVEIGIRLGLQFLDALEAVHGHGLVHGDVKTSNFLILADGTAVLTDFDTLQGARDMPTQVFGSHYFVAPERAGYLPQSEKVDLFGWGMTMAEICGGLRPYDPNERLAADRDRYLNALITNAAVAYTSSLPAPVRGAVDGAIRLNPVRRASAGELRTLLLSGSTTRFEAPAVGGRGVQAYARRPQLLVHDVQTLYRRGLRRLATDLRVYLAGYAVVVVAAMLGAVLLRAGLYALLGV